jgi:hypothetical protein
VKSHAKAPSLGSIMRQLARRGGSSKPGLTTGLLFALLLLACLAPASALAALSHPSLGAFGSANQPSFGNAEGLAVDQSSGDLLVIDAQAGTVSRYNPDGTPADFSALGTNAIDGKGGADETPQAGLSFSGAKEVQVAVDNSGGATDGDIYLTQSGALLIDIFGEDGSYLGQLTAAGLTPFGEACGVGVDSAGAVYVGDYNGVVHKFVPSANPPVNSDSTANFTRGEACTLVAGAGSSAGYVFSNSYNAGELIKIDSSSGEEKYPVSSGNTTVSVDPASGHVFAATGGSVNEYDASGPTEATLLSSISPGGEVSGVAVAGTSGNVYVARNNGFIGSSRVEVFGPAVPFPIATTEAATEVDKDSALLHGTVSADNGPEASCEFQYITEAALKANEKESHEAFQGATGVPCSPPGPFTGSSSEAVSVEAAGLSAGTEYRFRVLASNENGTTKGQPLGFRTAGPEIVSESVAAAGVGDATLSAKINPKGEPTSYHVEYGTTSSYGQSTPESTPIGFAGDEGVHTVSVHIGGLTSGTLYHFRFVATSVASAEGADKTFATYGSSSSMATCPNDQFRTGFGAALPDCRAYEQATPVDKHGSNINGYYRQVEAASGGNRITFTLNGGLPSTGGSSGFTPNMASRGPSGWNSDGLLPLTRPGFGARLLGWSEDLSTTLVEAPGPGNVGRAIYLRDSDTAGFQLGATDRGEAVAGFAADSSHFIFESEAVLAPGAVAGKSNLYDFDHGNLTLAGRIPAGSAASCDDESGPACVPAPEGSFAGPYGSCGHEGGANCGLYTQNTISRDGSKVIFTSAGGTRQLYLREDGTKTARISASQRTVPDPNGEKPALFMAATPDGSKVFFASCEKLTDDSTAVSNGEGRCAPESFVQSVQQGMDLYSYDTGTGELTDLTVDPEAGDPFGAAVVGVLGASDDGSYVYFVANGVLTDGEGAAPGECRSDGAAGDPSERCNLYVSHNGNVTFVGSLRETDSDTWSREPTLGTSKLSRVSADGRTLLFGSALSLTGYDNVSTVNGVCAGFGKEPCPELFRYSAPDEGLTCVSCNPTGIPPSEGASLAGNHGTTAINASHQTFLTRNLSADGKRVFFESPDPLLPKDTNGVRDVYEWEAKGSGSCESEGQNGGCIYLLSSGTSPDPSFFADASTDGSSAFIFTSQQLVPGDRDQLVDIYVASTGGGLASQHTLAPPSCTGVACQANPPPPPDQGTASSSFSGPGNAKPKPSARKCAKGRHKVRRAGKVRCQKAHKQHKRHDNRGGSK